MLRGSKVAASSSTFRVEAEISLVLPPMTPARATGPVPSVITMSLTSNARSIPSRVFMTSPGLARRTTMGPTSLSKSNACRGWPVSSNT